MVKRSSDNKAETARKATSKSTSGRKSNQPQNELNDLQRRQRALEQQFLQAEQERAEHEVNTATAQSGPQDQDTNDDLDLSGALSPERTDQQCACSPPSKAQHKGDPFACAITPQDPSPAQSSNPLDLQVLPEVVQHLIARAISHGIATGIREHRSASVVSESLHSRRTRVSPSASLTGTPERSTTRSKGSADLGLEDEPQRDTDLSDDDGAPPDVLAFTGLFPQELFKSLLHKAKVTSGLSLSCY